MVVRREPEFYVLALFIDNTPNTTQPVEISRTLHEYVGI